MRLVLALMLSGCSVLTPHKDPTRYFVLTANDASMKEQATSIGLGHVDLPEYLVRDSIVTRAASNQIMVSDIDLWGEPLKAGLERTLRRDLESQLGHVSMPPFEPAKPPTITVDVEVRHFEHEAGKGALLDAHYTVRKGGAVVAAADVHHDASAPDKDTGAEIAALSKTVAALASDISNAIRTLP